MAHREYLNENQMKYCQLVAKGHPSIDAYCLAYGIDKSSRTANSASAKLRKNLMCKQLIQKYLDEAEKDFSKELSYSKKEAMRELEEAYNMAQGMKNPATMKEVTRLKAELNGLILKPGDKVDDTGNKIHPGDVNAQILEMLKKMPTDFLSKMAGHAVESQKFALPPKSAKDFETKNFKRAMKVPLEDDEEDDTIDVDMKEVKETKKAEKK